MQQTPTLPTVKRARKTKASIETYMTHWNDGLSEEDCQNDFQGAKVEQLDFVSVTAEEGMLWRASFTGITQNLWFLELPDGTVKLPFAYPFLDL